MRRSRLGASVVVLALGAGGCNGATSADPTPAPSPTAAAASPSPSPAPSPSPSPTGVLPANDVDDPVAALEAIVAYYDYLFENPDPEKLHLIYAQRCPCFEEAHRALADMAESGERLEYLRQRNFQMAEIEERDGPFAQLTYREDSPGVQLLDADGIVVEAGPDEPELTQVRILLIREAGRWVVISYA